ncbi:MAG TPA: class E sortase [Pseudonocardiaceae bacterium]|nr:class E sortase [Pseudonocardiaceae bacterium]
MAHVLSPVRGSPPSHRRGDATRTAIRGAGELLLTAGLVVLLFVGYEAYVTDWMSAVKQREATAQLDNAWRNPRGVVDRPIEGAGMAKMYIPTFGPDFVFTVLEGTGQDTLAVGPGHYEDTALPGQPGNFAVAGHRVGKGSPFNSLDLLSSCDAIVVETIDHWFVYRVLPLRGESTGWAGSKATQPQCRGVSPLTGSYADVVGKTIVLPSQNEVIAPIPGQPDLPAKRDVELITLTTCHPQFSNRQRLIVHGILVADYPKIAGQRPAELTASV